MKVVISAWKATRLRFMCFYSTLSVMVLGGLRRQDNSFFYLPTRPIERICRRGRWERAELQCPMALEYVFSMLERYVDVSFLFEIDASRSILRICWRVGTGSLLAVQDTCPVLCMSYSHLPSLLGTCDGEKRSTRRRVGTINFKERWIVPPESGGKTCSAGYRHGILRRA